MQSVREKMEVAQTYIKDGAPLTAIERLDMAIQQLEAEKRSIMQSHGRLLFLVDKMMPGVAHIPFEHIRELNEGLIHARKVEEAYAEEQAKAAEEE